MAELVKLGEGREAEIFAWDDELVVRLMRDSSRGGSTLAALESQAEAMAAAKEAGCPVPAPGQIVEVDGRPGLLMERASGGDLLSLLGSTPWKVFAFGRLTAEIHHSLLLVRAPERTRSTRDRLGPRIENSGLDSARLSTVLRILESLPEGDRLCHGDFHPGNILFGERGPLVIDWTNVASGDPLNDVARTLMTLEIGEPPPGTPALVLRLLRIGRSLYKNSYLSRLRKLLPVDNDRLRDWQTVHLAARLAERIEPEVERIQALLAERLD